MKGLFVSVLLSGALSFFVVAAIAGFELHPLGSYPVDSYYVLESRQAIFLLAVVFVMWRFVYLLLDLMTTRYRVVALMVAFINPIVGLLIGLSTFFILDQLLHPGDSSSQDRKMTLAGLWFTLIILSGTFLLQTVVEVMVIKRLRDVVR